MIPTVLLMLWIVVFSGFATVFGIGSGVNMIELLPFFGLSIFQMCLLIFSFYLSLKLLKDRVFPFKESNATSLALIALGVLYFFYKLAIFLNNNIGEMNSGGEVQPVLAFLWGSLLVIFGVALRKKSFFQKER